MGFLHIYCGDGKGKTTAALGLAVRAAGAGMRVHIIQLLKGSDTAELTVLRSIPGITLERCERDFGFVWISQLVIMICWKRGTRWRAPAG